MSMRAKALEAREYTATDRVSCEAIFLSNVPRYFSADEFVDFTEFLNAPNAHYLVVLDQSGGVVGCGGCYVQGATGALCWGMVTQEFHGRAIGSFLLRERLAWLFAHPVVSEVSIRTSQRSSGFFERFGFSISKVVPGGLAPGLAEVSMTLSRASWSTKR